MSNAKSKQAKPKTGLARCMELASDRKSLVFLAAVLSSLAAIASFIPYIAIYFMIRSIIGVFPNLDQLDMGMVMNYGWLALTRVGGADVRDVSKEELMDTISFVFQNSRLLKGSILDNVRLGKPQATEAEVLAALKAAQCMDIIEKFPAGIHTVIGTKGVYLSGDRCLK